MAIREINLVPTEVVYQHSLKRHMGFWGGGLMMGLLLLLGIYLYQRQIIVSEKALLDQLKTEHQLLAAKMEESRKLKAELTRSKEQQEALNRIAKHPSYAHLLSHLAGIMNTRTWLTQLSIDGDQKTEKPNMMLMGFSQSNEDLGDFLNKLSRTPAFKTVVLRYAKEMPSNRKEEKATSRSGAIQFQIDCQI